MNDRKVYPLPQDEESKAPKTSTAQAPDWSFVNPATLQGVAVEPREFIVQDWLSRGYVTINYGDGGVGKTLLLQQLMTSAAASKPWCGLAVEPCRSLALFCEDDDKELHRRQDAICTAYGVDFRDLSEMRWASGVGQDNTLVSFSKYGEASPTPAFERLFEQAARVQAELVVIDTAADTFGGDENARRQVRVFVGYVLGKMAHELNAAVVLNAHPSRAGLAGDLDGGSTGWSNTARARWSLTRPSGDDADTNERLLTRRKANYAPIGETIRLRWQGGILAPIDAPRGFAAAAAAIEAEGVFLNLIARFTANGVRVSQSKHGTNWAPKLFANAPDCAGFTAKQFESAMARLLAAGRIEVRDLGRASRPIPALVIAEMPPAELV